MLSELLLGHDELSIADIAARTGIAYATVHAEVARLLSAGIVRERKAGRTRMISAAPQSPLVGPLRQILVVTTGPAVLLSEALARIEGVHQAFLFGSFAARAVGIDGPAPSDIDVMVVGDPDPDLVFDACARVEQAVARPVNPTILSDDEFVADTGFLRSVRENPTVALIGATP